jgi:protocatechuate 3,4-dioxygenase beta subunit
MSHENRPKIDRRTFLRVAASVVPAPFLIACADSAQTAPSAAVPTATAPPAASAAPSAVPAAAVPSAVPAATAQIAQVLAPTPECGDDDDDLTPAQTEGPYFTPNSPERTSLLEAGIGGTRLIVAGSVLTTSCQPVAGALMDFLQANDAGEYDIVGYQLRGHQFTDAAGRYSLETVLPGLYPGRTRHIHVKVQAPSQPVLTTQLYFPNEPANARDGIFAPALLMDVQAQADGSQAGAFDFVLDLG